MRVSNPVDLIIIQDNKILLCKRTSDKHGYKDTWSIPGGGTELNESFEEALHREIKEELGCKIIQFKYFKSYFMKLSEAHISRVVYFYGQIDGDINLNSELSEFKWFDINNPEMLKLNLAFNQKEVLKDFIEFWKES